jgi:hypothetical protein
VACKAFEFVVRSSQQNDSVPTKDAQATRQIMKVDVRSYSLVVGPVLSLVALYVVARKSRHASYNLYHHSTERAVSCRWTTFELASQSVRGTL